MTEPDPGGIRDGEHLDALRFVRAVFDDQPGEVHIEWSEAEALALANVVLAVLRVAARTIGKTTDAEADEYASAVLDTLITQAMLSRLDG